MTEDPQSHESSAREYAWSWFEYHASQRQTVFRFFLLLAGAITGGYLTFIKDSGHSHLAPWFGLLLVVLSLLFWRLDVRSRDLINFAEIYLRREEDRLSNFVGQEIRISSNAHETTKHVSPIFCYAYTFRQVYRLIFIMIGLIGVAIFLLDAGSPLRTLLARIVSMICRT